MTTKPSFQTLVGRYFTLICVPGSSSSFLVSRYQPAGLTSRTYHQFLVSKRAPRPMVCKVWQTAECLPHSARARRVNVCTVRA